MRVLVVVDSLSIGNGVMGVIMNYYRFIHNEIHFDFLYMFESDIDFKNEIQELGGKFQYLTPPSLNTFFKFRIELNDFFKKNHNNYSVVHVHEVLLNYFVFKLCKKYDINTRIIHSHNSVGSESIVKSIRNKLLCLRLKSRATDLWACSDKAASYLYGKKYSSFSNYRILNNAVDVAKFAFNISIRQNLRKQNSIPEDAIILGHVGRFCVQKNHSFLLDIFQSYHKTNSNSYLLLIGSGELTSKIKGEVLKRKLIDKVIFLGSISNVSDYLNAMDIFLLPSLFEGLPVVGVEAQANGLPTLFSDSITKSVQILSTSHMLSINRGTGLWVEKINNIVLNNKAIDRSTNIATTFRNESFDLSIESKKLQMFYLSRQ